MTEVAEIKNTLYANSQIVFDWCMKNCEPKVALDIGANIGSVTHTMVEKGFIVHAFEPVPIPFAELYFRFAKDYRVKCHNLGMSDKEEELKDTTVCITWTLGTPETTGLSVKPEYKDHPHFDVKFTTIDKYVSEHNLKIGFIKLDVDGYELKVLKGGEKTIREQMPPMMIELSSFIKAITGSEEEYVKFIFDLGYRMYSMDGEAAFENWEDVKCLYPYNTSFDVMLLTPEMSLQFGKEKYGL